MKFICFIIVTLLFQVGLFAADKASLVKGTIQAVQVGSNSSGEYAYIFLDLDQSITVSGIVNVLAYNTKKGLLRLDASSAAFKDMLSLALFLKSSNEEAIFEIGPAILDISVNSISMVCGASPYVVGGWLPLTWAPIN